MRKRYNFIDGTKGFAVILMICFHMFGLWYVLSLTNISINEPLLLVGGRIAVILFIFFSGINFYISTSDGNVRKYAQKITKLFICSVIITVTSYVFVPTWAIYFGIIHFFTVLGILCVPLYLKKISVMNFCMLLIALQLLIHGISSHSNYSYIFLPLGYYPVGFTTIDYYPIFPWIYLFMAGLAVAQQEKRYQIFNTLERISKIIPESLILLGKHSLVVYMIHFPILCVLTYLLILIKE